MCYRILSIGNLAIRKTTLFRKATWFEEAAVERGGLGKEKDRGDLEDPQNPTLGTLASTFWTILPIDRARWYIISRFLV